jgi:predicted metal-dependent peptidase
VSALDQRKLAAARLAAATRLPYLASALFASAAHPVPGSGTVAVTRRWQVHADPAVVDSLSVDELARLLVHLTGHLLRDHAARAPGDDGEGSPAQWNRAADAEINDDLARDDFVPKAAPDLPGDLGCVEGRLAEEYLAAGRPGPRRWDCGSGCDGQARPGEEEANHGSGRGIYPAQAHLLTLGVAAEIQRRHAQEPGTVPGGWLRWAETVLPSRVDWRRVLAAEIRRGVAITAGKVDYTYRRPSRRAAATPGVIMPSLIRPLPSVAVVCDTSGSMHEHLLARALAEVEGLLTRAGLRHAQLRVLAVDTQVHAVRRVTNVRQVELAGGGGTDMGAGIAAAAALRPPPSLVVVITDGFTPWPAQAPKGCRVVVALLEQHGMIPGHHAPPTWARVIRIPDEPTGHHTTTLPTCR